MKTDFMAYDKKNKRFIDPGSVAVNGHGEIYLFEKSRDVDGYTQIAGSGTCFDIELCEYSGKKDRTGRKLFEGDIIKAVLPMCEDRFAREADLLPKTIIGVVVIRPSEGARILVKKVVPEDTIGISKGRTIRIKQDSDIRIGHVYTNPELLE